MAPTCLGLLATFQSAAADEKVPEDDLSATVARMARIGTCYGTGFAPDGARLAFIADLSGTPQVWTISSDGGWPDQVTDLSDQVRTVEWSPTGSQLAITVAPGGGMNTQVYLVRPDGTGLRRLTDGGKETNQLQGWTHDGRSLRISSNRRQPAFSDAYLVDVEAGRWRLVAETGGVGGLTDVSRDGRRAVVSRLVNRGDNNLDLVDLASGQEAKLTLHEGLGRFSGGKFSPDGQTIYLSSDKDRDLPAFAQVVLDTDSGRPGPIEVLAAREGAELDDFEINEQGTLAALIWNVDGQSELELFDLSSHQSTSRPALPVEMVVRPTFSKDGRLLAMAGWGATAPPDIWVLDLRAGRFRQLTRSPHAGVDLSSLVRPGLHRFKAHDGLNLSGWLYRPQGARGPGPIVLSFHGGPEGQERLSFNNTYQALLTRGIAVFAPNVRGSSGFGKRFVNLDNGVKRFGAIEDIKSCVDYVVKQGVADPKRIGIMGGSYGGFMVMAGLTVYPDLFAAGADLFGIVNFKTFFDHTEPWMASISKVEYGNPETEAELLRSLSPIHRIDRIAAPTIVLHGANDTNVPVVEAEQVVERLKARGTPVEYVLFPDEGHGFRKAPNRVRAAVAIVRWFDRYLEAKP
jgi:dipeptidyl aminopeptidase/acylaminoacyl peptidase